MLMSTMSSKALIGHLQERLDAANAGIVDHDVQAPIIGHHVGHEFLHVFVGSHVDVIPFASDFSGDLIRLFLVDVGDGDGEPSSAN